jgi:nucleotide-binding universal stress UspA family protein
MKSVLVPLDGTRNAEAALVSLAALCDPGDRVVLLKVEKPETPQRSGFRPGPVVTQAIVGPFGGATGVASPDVPVYFETGEQTVQRQLAEAQDYLETLASELREKGFQVDAEVLIDDHADRAIVEYARILKPAFIAMLRRTNQGVAERIFGSVASSVLKADVAPVLFVPAPASA